MRNAWRTVGLVGGCGVLIGLAVFVRSLNWTPTTPEEARTHAVKVLANARTAQELRKAVGGLGVLLVCQDGSWIAIRYDDSHEANSFWSCALAFDSDGNWYESNYHFCGNLGGYLGTRESYAAMEEAGPIPSYQQAELYGWEVAGTFDVHQTPGALYAIEKSANLEQAIPILLRIQFRRLTEATQPQFKGKLPSMILGWQ
jgi:hypothetical protein